MPFRQFFAIDHIVVLETPLLRCVTLVQFVTVTEEPQLVVINRDVRRKLDEDLLKHLGPFLPVLIPDTIIGLDNQCDELLK